MEEKQEVDKQLDLLKRKIIKLKNKVVVLKEREYGDEVDIEDILSIHHGNIVGDILTFPVALNRIGNLKNECDDYVKKLEHSLDHEVEEFDEFKGKLEKNAFKKLKESGIKSPTLRQIEVEVLPDPAYKEKRERIRQKQFQLIEAQTQQGHVENIYWSCKGKLDLLTKISDKIKPDDFENKILEESINGFSIKMVNKLIQSKF